ncbi:MAG: hypothetical protein LUE87_00810, partial [Lachnospiraceae bacterium]|nr:hypothetical protein [Lachnospiraceae bacterium]
MEPSFICIGFQKCGTTSLYDLFKKNKYVYLTEDVKEPMYYRVPFMRRFLGRRWYCQRYFGHYVEAVLGKTDNACEVGLITGRRGHGDDTNTDSAARHSESGTNDASRGLSSCTSDISAKTEGSGAAPAAANRHRLIAGEINAGLGYKNCAKWVGKDFAPNTKLVFMMRDPADRCYS